MLNTALRSVASQTYVDRIERVLVIENGRCRESEFVCAKFGMLPIHYVFRDVPLPPGYQSVTAALKHIESEYLAILFDDDWWMPEHLANSTSVMSNQLNIVASYSAYLRVAGEHMPVLDIGDAFLPWFGAARELDSDHWVMNIEDLIVANVLATTGALMTLVVKADVWQKCLCAISNNNPYDYDRLLAVELGKYGQVAFSRRPTVYVRRHAHQESTRIENEGEAIKWWNISTEQIVALALEKEIDLSRAISTRMQEKSVSWDELRRNAYAGEIKSLKSLGVLPSGEVEVCNPNLATFAFRLKKCLLQKFAIEKFQIKRWHLS